MKEKKYTSKLVYSGLNSTVRKMLPKAVCSSEISTLYRHECKWAYCNRSIFFF